MIKRKSKERKVSSKVFRFTAYLLNDNLQFLSAKNSLYSSNDISAREYAPECDLRALLLRQLEQIPYIKDLVKWLNRYKEMRLACGYGEKVPTEAHFS